MPEGWSGGYVQRARARRHPTSTSRHLPPAAPLMQLSQFPDTQASDADFRLSDRRAEQVTTNKEIHVRIMYADHVRIKHANHGTKYPAEVIARAHASDVIISLQYGRARHACACSLCLLAARRTRASRSGKPRAAVCGQMS
jgi:hypothetical protein